MTPRNSQQGATATARWAPGFGKPRAAASPRTRSPRTTSPKAARSSATAVGRAQTAWRDATAARWWLLPVVVTAALALCVWAYYPVARVQYRETRERARLQAELSAIQARNARLRTQVARLKTPEGVEDYARTQLGMVKQGENVIVVVDGTEPTPTVLPATAGPRIDSEEAVKPPVGPWTAFLDSVFGIR